MAKAQHSAKAAAKKRIVKVDTYGDAHITASFQQHHHQHYQQDTARLFPGAVPVKWVLKVLKKILHMLPRWLLQMLQK